MYSYKLSVLVAMFLHIDGQSIECLTKFSAMQNIKLTCTLVTLGRQRVRVSLYIKK